MEIFNINHTLFTLLGYNVGLLELVGTVLGILSVWLATKGKAANFVFGIIGMTFLTVFFFFKGLYSSMILQVILISFCAWGFYTWTKPQKNEVKSSKKVTILTRKQRLLVIALIASFVALWGSMMVFFKPAFLNVIFPENYDNWVMGYADAFVLMVSMTGMYLRTQKKLESWYVFFTSDTMGLVLYGLSGAYFVVMMCAIYWLLDIKGIVGWRGELRG